ncbi:transposase Tn3 family protein [Burkholderia humptydooensis MSMB43]|uniref:Transposase Tn3 family protein n=1 Tax=Burkholderia humptydooensis MSMB43 TaxID=441157 RepID=A0ABN0G2W5_9BURK|nr:transposase Tn3 family protein [Burkholderia humptydooensis MSMB43]
MSKVLAAGDLEASYTPLPEELKWVRRSTRGERPRLGLLVLFKIFQQMHYFPVLDAVPAALVDHVRVAAGIGVDVQFGYDTQSSPTSFRHYAAIRDYLGVTPYYGSDANAIATRAAHTAALAMDQPVDIINATIDEFIAQNIELPAFSTLDRIAEQIHAKTQTRLLRRVARRLTDGRKRRSIEN